MKRGYEKGGKDNKIAIAADIYQWNLNFAKKSGENDQWKK